MADKFDKMARELEAANPTGDMAVRVAGILRAASFNACEAATGILGEVRERSFLEGRAIGHEEGLAQGRAERDGQDHSRPTQALRDAAQMVTRLWADFISQEMYGDWLRAGLEPRDFEHMETEMQRLRVALRGCEAPVVRPPSPLTAAYEAFAIFIVRPRGDAPKACKALGDHLYWDEGEARAAATRSSADLGVAVEVRRLGVAVEDVVAAEAAPPAGETSMRYTIEPRRCGDDGCYVHDGEGCSRGHMDRERCPRWRETAGETPRGDQ